MKKIIRMFMLSLFAVALAVSASVNAKAAEKDGIPYFGVSFSADGRSYTVKCQPQKEILGSEWYFDKPEYLQKTKEENILHLILPYDAASAQLTADVAENAVFLDGTAVADGDALSLTDGAQYTLSADGKSYILNVSYGSDIPIVYIITENGSIENLYPDKNIKESAYISIADGGKNLCDTELDFIKCRGNFTWAAVPKKSFSIKFMEETDLMGMGASQRYALLANHTDLTMVRNRLSSAIAERTGLLFTPQSEFVDLYIDSEYMGLYVLSEKVEISPERVDITDLEQQTADLNPYDRPQDGRLAGVRDDNAIYKNGSRKWVEVKNNPQDITGGYIIELQLNERYYESASGFMSQYGQAVVLNSPEYASEAQVNYIADYYQQFEDAVMSTDGYNSLGKHYSEYVDMDSLVKMHLVHEYAKNLDAGITSFYFFKDTDGKLVAAPIWDIDSGFGRFYERNGVDFNDPNGLFVSGSKMVGLYVENKHSLLALLWKHEDYRNAVYSEWHTTFAPQTENILADFDAMYGSVEKSILNDRQMWLGGNLTENSIERWCAESADFVRNFVRTRSDFLSEIYTSDNLRVEYAPNGGWHFTIDGNLYPAGTKAVAMENGFRYDGADFIGWNTQPDGSGTQYQPGDTIEVTENTTLYAQWSLHPTTQQPAEEGGIMGLIKRIIRKILG